MRIPSIHPMASKQVALVLHRRFGRVGTVLIYAFLEWVLLLLLMIWAVLSYLTTNFARYFGLHPPCVWCNSLQREDQRSLVCDLHAAQMSSLAYCHAHKRLAHLQGMCEDCLAHLQESHKVHGICSCCMAPLERGIRSVGPKWGSLGHIAYTQLKHTSDSGSDISAADDRGSQVELIPHSLVQGLDHYEISALNNPFLDPHLEMTVLETRQHQNDISQTLLVGEDRGTVAMMSSDDSGKHHEVCGPAQKSVQLLPSSSLEQVSAASYERLNKEISPSEGESQLQNNRISDCDHSVVLPAESACYSKHIVQDNEVCSGTQILKPVEEKESSSQSESGQVSQQIEANVRKAETNAINVTVFSGEDANKPQQEMKLSSGFFPSRELFRTDLQNSHTVVVGMSTAEDYRTPETPRFIEGLHMLHKRVSIDRNDSGFDSLDGSILSEIEGESAVDRLKRQLELERKSLNTLYLELEAERNASAIAANQAMAMITRLQEEKAAMQMEALQYQRMMEEQAEYDQEALQLLNEVLAKREKEIKDLEMEVEIYRKRFRYEAIKERKDKRRKNSSEKTGTHLERKRNLHNHLPNDQYEKVRTSSISSLNEDTDESSSSHQETGDIYLQQNNQSTPVELTMNVSGVYEEQQLEDSFYESIVDLEEERLSILERLKTLEEKLHIFADDGEYDFGKQQKKNSDIVTVHPDENVEPQKYSEAMIEENRSSCLGTVDDASNGNGESVSVQCKSGICNDLTEIHWKESQKNVNTGNVDPSAQSMLYTARKPGVVEGKKLLPLFESISFEEESYDTEGSHTIAQSNDWHSTSMIARDNTRLAIEEEVHDLNERLQALEADREFIRHSLKSLKKGDEGMKLLQEISQHLRELRKLDMRASSLNDSFVQENAVFDSSLERNGTITIQPNYCIS